MTLPVSSYEALLLQVRELTHETILLQQQLSADLFDNINPTDVNHNLTQLHKIQANETLSIANVIDRDIGRLSESDQHQQRTFADRESTIFHPTPPSLHLDNAPETLDASQLRAKLISWRDSIQNHKNQAQEETALRRGKQSATLHPDKPVYYHPASAYQQTQVNQETVSDYTNPLIRCKYNGSDNNVMDLTTREQKGEAHSRTSRCYDEEGSSEDDIKAEESSEGNRLSTIYHGTWPVKRDSWTGQGFSGQSASNSHEMASVMSFSSTSACSSNLQGQRRLGAKVDVVYSLLGMLGSTEGREDMSSTLLAMSNSMDSCLVMRQSGCLPLLVQLIHAPGQDPETRDRAARALHNVIHARTDEKIGRREARVLRLLEQIRDFCQVLRHSLETERPPDDLERHPGPTIAALMKLSFDEAHRHAMCQLGGLHAVAELIEVDHAAHGSESDDQSCLTLRRYAGMALTNLTFGDGNNKALLCSFREFMKALVSQLRSLSDDLRQVTASVLRNLSWRADSSSKQTLREVGAVTGLMKAAMEGRKESTLKSILSALWNLSAHCSTNKVDICAVEGALAFLVDMLSYKAPSKTLAIVENAGGILRNVSSHIAVREDYRVIVRERGCLQVLLRQLRSPSLTVVSNACGALWNLSARCPHDQRLLWDLGAVPMLRSLVHSKHKMISMGASAALKNLLSARPGGSNLVHLDSTARGLGLPTLPTLNARRQRALEQEIDQNLSETCENIEPSTSPTTKEDKFTFKETSVIDPTRRTFQGQSTSRYNGVPRSESRESMRSVTSTHSDTIFERVNRHVLNGLTPSEIQLKQQSSSLHAANGLRDLHKTAQLEKKYALRYKNTSVGDRLRPTDFGVATSTISWTTGPDQESACSLVRSSIEDKLSVGSSKPGSECSFSKLKSPGAKSPIGFEAAGFAGKPLLSPTLSHASDSDPFGNYAETDLDQPTNYSLRYAERNSDEDEKQSSGYFAGSEQDIEDTVKTYYTEGTPYGTSLNSSRATSHSDLQEDGKPRNFILEKPQTRKLDAEETEIIMKIKDTTLKTFPKRSSYIERTGTKISPLSPAAKRLSLPPNAIEILSDIDSGVPAESEDTNDSEIVVESTITRLNSIAVGEGHTFVTDKRLRELRGYRKQTGEPESLTESMPSDGDDDDEDLLAACIHVGMQNNRHRQSFHESDAEIATKENDLAKGQANSENQAEFNIKQDVGASEETEDSAVGNSDHLENKNNVSLEGEKTVIKGDVDSAFDATASIEDNECVDLPKSDNATPLDMMSSESIDSYDSVERSEQVLLQLCIKSSPQTAEKMGLSESTSSIDLQTKKLAVSQDQHDGLTSSKCKKSAVELTEESNEDEYRRQRDPDAMIASLDRLTATLVQQTEAMRERESCAMKQSTQSDTWNEDSPNDSSFPTISMSVPLVASFKSDSEEDKPEETATLSLNDDHMTTSKIIEQEALKLAEAVTAEFGAMSLTNNDLEAIKPPSTMGSLVSLTTSYAGTEDHSLVYSNSICSPVFKHKELRKKSLPVGIVARRALGQAQSHTGSLESLIDHTINVSQLENMKPPSMMDEILDGGDMENSMLSVASICSEIADSKDPDSNSLTSSDPVFDLVKPIANVLSMTCMKYAQNSASNSLSEYLENINPPSLFNEISEIDDTTIDANTDTMCSDTLCIDVELKTEEIHPAVIEEGDNDTDEAATPIPSSSAESTPKKRLKSHLTPKQKRQLAKERFKTYTIAAELVKKEEEERRKNGGEAIVSRIARMTPKQRRREDRARFQTQILENPLAVLNQNKEDDDDHTRSIDTATVTIKSSGIPSLKNLCGSGTFRKNKAANKDRYQTKTLEGSDRVESTEDSNEGTSEGIQTMLEQNAKVVIRTLNETKTDESLLDYETISLVSNESEISLKMRLGNDTNFSTYVKKGKSRQQANEADVWKVVEEPTEAREIPIEDPLSETNSESDSESEAHQADEQPKRPRIIKPGSRDGITDSPTEKSEPGSPKAIRGRRKALYTAPRKITPNSSPVKQITTGIPRNSSAPNGSPVVRATRATTLRQNTNTPTSKIPPLQKPQPTPRTVALSKRSSIPQRGSATPAPGKTVKRHSTPPAILPNAEKKQEPPKPLERQGTFTKDEPEVENAPLVTNSPVKSKIAKPTRGSPSKIPGSKIPAAPKIVTRNVQSKLTKCASADGIPLAKQTQKVTKSPEVSAQNGKKPMNLGQRSNSNSSIVSPQNAKKLTKEATSKIASLWKKVEENRNKQKYERPDTRKWITAERMTDDCANEENVSPKLPKMRLFRSSTFEGVPKESGLRVPQLGKLAEGLAYRNSCDLTGVDATEAPCRISKMADRDVPLGYATVVLRKQRSEGSEDDTKRISRLGSFFRVESEEGSCSGISGTINNFAEISDTECLNRSVTASSRVTTV